MAGEQPASGPEMPKGGEPERLNFERPDALLWGGKHGIERDAAALHAQLDEQAKFQAGELPGERVGQLFNGVLGSSVDQDTAMMAYRVYESTHDEYKAQRVNDRFLSQQEEILNVGAALELGGGIAVPLDQLQFKRIVILLDKRGQGIKQRRTRSEQERYAQEGVIELRKEIEKLGLAGKDRKPAPTKEHARILFISLARKKDEIAVMRKVLKDPKAMRILMTNKDSQAAFRIVLSQNAKLRAEWAAIEKFWQQDQFADVFPPPLPEIADVEPVSGKAVSVAVQESGLGNHLLVSPLTGDGELSIAGMWRPVALRSVDGQPRFFIRDANADRGWRGPVEPQKMKDELTSMSIDNYFSQKFREFAPSSGEKDPNAVLDSRLFKIVRAFLPKDSVIGAVGLGPKEKLVVANLARLLAQPDSEYISMEEKSRRLERLAGNQSSISLARNELSARDFSKEKSGMAFGSFIEKFA